MPFGGTIMATVTLETKHAMAVVNWHTQEWQRHELETVKRLARLAGAYAYQGPRWSNAAIRREARHFLVQSLLLSPFQTDPTFNRLVIGNFLEGWHLREEQEQEP